MDADKEQLVGRRPFSAPLSEGVRNRLTIRANIQRRIMPITLSTVINPRP